MKTRSTPDVVGTVGGYRVIMLSKVLNPTTESRRCMLRRHKTTVQGVTDYHTDMDLMSHLGTHVEAPYHHGDYLKDVSELGSVRFLGRSVLLRLATCQARALISAADLDAADGGEVRAGDVVLLDSPYHHTPFVPSPEDERPQLSRESAEWFLAKGVKAVGFGDGVAIENNPEHCIAVHDLLMVKDVTFIEVMQNLDKLTQKIFLLVFLPLPIRGLDASPVHVVAIEGIPGF